MDTRSATSEPQHIYPRNPWPATARTNPIPLDADKKGRTHSKPLHRPSDTATHCVLVGTSTPLATHLDFVPLLFPQQNVYHAQLLHYNRLVSPARGGGLQTPPLPPVVSSPNIQAGPRSRSSSRVSLKDAPVSKGNTAGGNGSRSQQNSDRSSRLVITPTDTPPKMAPKQSAEASRSVPPRSSVSASLSHAQSHSNSVPSTPHQHARQFSFESREPSPTSGNSHSPRSAYSETNSTLPSLRPLPPRLGGCKYETAQINSRRRIPYSVGNDRLEKLDLRTVKGKLAEDEEKKLASDMRDIYDRLLPTPEVEEKRKKLVRKLERIFNEEWPGHDIRVNLFGSSGNLLCSDDSDLDICITTSWHELEGVCMIADLLARRGMEKVVCISAAKVPIVKIWDPELGLACDMNVNNTSALENTRMVRIYVEADPRVRQLAMIIKYWTRRRIVNDAAFGGTLSSYTWICLIIAFLQLRDPPVLPALHQMPYKSQKPDGTFSEFADNLRRIKGFGNKNRSSVADLLFQFFRFYAHEFDYDKHVLSIRQGKLITKQEKKWNYAVNNQLCVEEPFNTNRNLGNTVDEYSFRGVHLELRRAFDLLTQAKLEEVCEQYVFPKEEGRVWTRPAPQSRPVLLRSSSQTHSSRGGRGSSRGSRHSSNFHRGGGGPNRRASAGTPAYDSNVFTPPMGMQQDMPWFQGPHYQFPYGTQDLMTHLAYQQFLYGQQSAFVQHQALGQPSRMSVSSGSAQQGNDRSRTSSFDNVSVNASLRPDLYALYGMNLGHTFFPQTGYGTYPSTPAASSTPGAPEFRRSLQRSGVSTDGNVSMAAGSLRSQSQPAQRSPSADTNSTHHVPGSQTPASATADASRNFNMMAMPSFISDDSDFDETPKAASDLAECLETKPGGSFFQSRSLSPNRQLQVQAQQRRPQPHPPAGITFGDLTTLSPSPDRRRLSTDQLPQSLLDRRIRRASRSPSPMGHARAFSVGGHAASTPLTAASFANGQTNKTSTRPLVVNGSGVKASVIPSHRQAGQPSDVSVHGDPFVANGDNALRISAVPVWPGRPPINPSVQQRPSTSQMPADRPPVVVNGSNAPPAVPPPTDEASFKERIEKMQMKYLPQPIQQEVANGNTARLSPSARQRSNSRQPQSGVIAPLDLAIADPRVGKKALGHDTAHLSPVYETTRLPSPSATRKQANVVPVWPPNKVPIKTEVHKAGVAGESRESPWKKERESQHQPSPSKNTSAPNPTTPSTGSTQQRENGHVRAAKSEGDGGWQRATGKGRKKTHAASTVQATHVESPPRYDADRKGG